ncbi:MAG: peptidyl-prolyl cis-trans isomerase [Agathobacter sp.]|uniref:peptidyl-prolyl cis-trans isomerase n=1 Tax=Agathobacter sp. TaxID=2021311 RepID=UPI002E78C709|nr:peptidyl-prolyl cis-trans isomerase [Agathobacter sp.]MEE1217819.1 peptidyl-prolyl cis-trans isomerase [Agathobacter sp.]
MKAKKVIAMLLVATLSVTAFTGCTINKNATVATLDKEDIKLGLVNFMIRYQEAGYDDMYIQYMGEGYWDKTVSGNDTVLETWKKNAIEEAHELYTLKAHQSDYDVEVSDDEKKEIKKAAKKFMKANSDDAIDEMGASEDIVEEYLKLRLIKSKMYASIIKNADSSVTDEEANMAAYTIVKLDYKGAYDANYQYQTYTDEQSAQIKAQADAVVEALAGGSSLEDAAKAAGTTATTGTYATYVDPDAEKTDDSDKKSDDTESTESSESSDSKTKDSVYTTNNLDKSVVDALNSLEEGQTSDLITTDSTYYIVRLDKKTDEEATESNRKTVKGNKEDKYYNGILSGWQDDEKWSVKQKQLDKIKIHNYFTTTKKDKKVADTSATESTQQSESTNSTDTENTEAVDGTEN